MPSHFRALILKEWLLLTHDFVRVICEFALPIALGLLIFTNLPAPTQKHGGSLIGSHGYVTSSHRITDLSPNAKKFGFENCLDTPRNYSKTRKWIGIAAEENPDGILFRNLLYKAFRNYSAAPLSIKEFSSESALLDYASKVDYNNSYQNITNQLCMGISFEKKGDEYGYKLFLDEKTHTFNEKIYDEISLAPDLGTFDTMKAIGGYQTIVESVIAKIALKNNDTFIAYLISPLRVKPFVVDSVGIDQRATIIMVYMIFCAMVTLIYLVSRMQSEKTEKVRDFMRMMGMNDTPYYMSYFLFHVICSFLVSLIITGFCKSLIYVNTSVFLIFIQVYLVYLNIFAYAILLNSIFKSGAAAKNGSGLIYLLAFVVFYRFTHHTSSSIVKMAFSLIPQIAAYFSFTIMEALALHTDSVSLDMAFTNFNDYSIAKGWIFMIVDTVLMILIGLYLDNVLPGIGGVRRSWYYFLTSDYWCPQTMVLNNSLTEMSDTKREKMLTDEEEVPFFEEVSHDLKSQEGSGECFNIKNVTKKFDDGKVAVKNVSLEIYKGQVFILLGHNGAGKTTMLSMLNGLLSPSSGQAWLHGIDVFKNNLKLKEVLGICPQESIVYGSLTIEEHLKIFCPFKGIEYESQKELLNDIMCTLALRSSLHKEAKNLSGGQKRKLSVLLSLVGDPAVMMLDEPTSGLDVDARKRIWEVINKHKKDKIILMTTHYMDEAEQLGDRIAIMSDGELRCCGSSLFLKKSFKTGYYLTMVKGKSFDQAQATNLIERYAKDSQIKLNSSSEIIYNVPFEASGNFPQMFEELDQNKEQVGVDSYGMTITSLEDVFLKVGEERNKPVSSKKDKNNYSISRTHKHSFFANMFSVCIKIWLQAIRNKRQFILEVLFPLLMFAYGLVNIPYGAIIEYSYNADTIPIRSFVPINQALANTNDFFLTLKEKLPYEYKDVMSTGKTTYERIINFDAKEFDIYKDQLHFGAYYVESLGKNESLQAVVMGNARWPQTVNIFCTLLTNAFLQAHNPNIIVTPKIIPIKIFDKEESTTMELSRVVIFVLITGIALSVPIASIAYFIVKERKSGEKFLQILHGMNIYEYWLGRFIADYMKLAVPFTIIIIIKQLPYYELVTLVTICGVLVSGYALSYAFDDENKIMLITQLVFFLAGIPAAFILTLLKFVDVFSSGSPSQLIVVIDMICKIIPLYNIVSTLLMVLLQSLLMAFGKYSGYWNFYCLGQWLIMIISAIVLYFFLIWLIEILTSVWKRSGIQQIHGNDSDPVKDNDVKSEEEKVQQELPDSTAVHITKARKTYNGNKAVDNVSFSVNNGEVFSLLGVNGAGKTTMFKMLTLQVKPNCGTFFIHGIDMYSKQSDVVKPYIGYCPQDDVLFEALTVREHLEFYAKIKGVITELRQEIISTLIEGLGFGENENKQAWKLSGGNKRKLCTAIALLGHPEVLLLDEPTTGLDPKSRRDVWEVIRCEVTGGIKSAVVLTSHSMEEVEALSTKVAIMVAGNFRCFGSNQHLKSKYGDSYDLEFKVTQPVYEKIQTMLRGLDIDEDQMCNSLIDVQNLIEKMNIPEARNAFNKNNPRALHIIQKVDAGIAINTLGLAEFALIERFISLTLNSVREKFTSYKLVEGTAMVLKLQVPRVVNGKGVSFGELFKYADQLKTQGYIKDYSICETTLENIFQYFANKNRVT